MSKSVSILSTLVLVLSAVAPHLSTMLARGGHFPRQNKFGDLTDLPQDSNSPQHAQWIGVKSMRVLDRNNLWIVAHSMTKEPFAYATFVLHSSDGSRSWEIQLRESARDLNDVFFINHKVGWVCGSGGLILKSTDGGENWSEQDTPTEDDLNEIQFIDREVGWAASGRGETLRTTDGGQHWTSHRIDVQGELFVLRFRDSLNGWLIGHDKQAYESTDGGVTWNSRGEELARLVVPSGWYQAYFQTAKFLGPKIGFIVAHVRFEADTKAKWRTVLAKNIVFKTEDGGRSWRVLYDEEGPVIVGAEFVSEMDVWIILKGAAVLHSEDGGRTWSKVSTLPSSDIVNLYFVDSKNGWATEGDDAFRSKLFYTTDCGKNWIRSDWSRITLGPN